MPNELMRLDEDLWMQLTSHLPPADVFRLAVTSSEMHKSIHENYPLISSEVFKYCGRILSQQLWAYDHAIRPAPLIAGRHLLTAPCLSAIQRYCPLRKQTHKIPFDLRVPVFPTLSLPDCMEVHQVILAHRFEWDVLRTLGVIATHALRAITLDSIVLSANGTHALISHLQNTPRLQSLVLRSVRYDVEQAQMLVEVLGSLLQLEHLEFENTNIPETAWMWLLPVLGRLPLKTLGLVHAWEFDAAELLARELPSIPTIQRFRFYSSCSDDESVQQVIQALPLLPDLRSLHMILSEAEAFLFARILPMLHLEGLHLSFEGQTNHGMLTMVPALLSQTQLRRFSTDAWIDTQTAFLMSWVFLHWNRLEHLSWTHIGLQASTMVIMLKTFHTSLLTLNLHGTSLGCAGLVELAPELMKFTALKKLDLSATRLTANCAGELAGVISALRGLETLDLSRNSLGDDGVRVLYGSILGLPRLKKLGLRRLGISGIWTDAVSDVRRVMPLLEVLHV